MFGDSYVFISLTDWLGRVFNRFAYFWKLQVGILWEDNFFASLVLSRRRSDGTSLDFYAGSLKARSTQNN